MRKRRWDPVAEEYEYYDTVDGLCVCCESQPGDLPSNIKTGSNHSRRCFFCRMNCPKLHPQTKLKECRNPARVVE